MPKLSIDGKEIEVEPGTNLIEAARRLGIEVPHYCYHPGLSIVAGMVLLRHRDEHLDQKVSACTRVAQPTGSCV